MKRVHVIVEGRVQGVGFRYFVQHEALKRQLTGWVKNNDDGTVEMEVQGHESAVQLFLDTIEAGTMFAKVSRMHIEQRDVRPDEKQFRIMYGGGL
ncbi:acylphosphatase [Geobacillus thermodenitrificans]|jgi:acylphosphatase|uniref:acylphosphatase n=2 Tax=Geobacillus thermodenitrificans TaxID=33940 RepID=UPI000A28DD37|nr:acylphosphatase [Geobacillus thermodenitrificans]ARP41456.1 Acylphosphatase [Geobacillus thermodenitrificans]MEC5189167.1 acylphosphatase [Geobacillus thermodenitrificans]MED0664319.1 acylphosphatase [Geobacillus thermodenitrificans]MED3904816.1 acylphosphatase [Geobacillus thermodenitrificans]MED4918136.1 acylphosphatase [Geobacillus thermodenitrificans]